MTRSVTYSDGMILSVTYSDGMTLSVTYSDGMTLSVTWPFDIQQLSLSVPFLLDLAAEDGSISDSRKGWNVGKTAQKRDDGHKQKW